jgi:hypothetical protein
MLLELKVGGGGALKVFAVLCALRCLCHSACPSAMQVMSNAMLGDQIVGNFFFRLCFHEAPWPRALTWAGSVVMLLGVAATVLASRVRISRFRVILQPVEKDERHQHAQ